MAGKPWIKHMSSAELRASLEHDELTDARRGKIYTELQRRGELFGRINPRASPLLAPMPTIPQSGVPILHEPRPRPKKEEPKADWGVMPFPLNFKDRIPNQDFNTDTLYLQFTQAFEEAFNNEDEVTMIELLGYPGGAIMSWVIIRLARKFIEQGQVNDFNRLYDTLRKYAGRAMYKMINTMHTMTKDPVGDYEKMMRENINDTVTDVS